MTTEQKLTEWLDKMLAIEIPDKSIIAYWFGICETNEGYEIYLVGSNEYNENDDDWACNVDFVPNEKYLLIGELGVDWELILEELKQSLKNYFQSPNFKNSFLANAKAIACGFDGGDLYLLKNQP